MSSIAADVERQLLERSESISALSGLLASVQADATGRLVWIGGEAGVGKTSLLRRFCEFQPKPARALWGGCEPLRTPRPLGPFLDIAGTVGGELARLVAAAARPHEVTVTLLDALRGRGLTVLVLEDLHWADEATLDVLTLLAARIRSVPALVLASYRDDELERGSAAEGLLGELARASATAEVERLSRAAVADAGRAAWPGRRELYGRTGGNPFFVTEVLATGGERLPELCVMPFSRAPLGCPNRHSGCSTRWRSSRPRLSCGCSRRSPATLRCSTSALPRACWLLRGRPSPSATSWPGWRSRSRSLPTAAWSCTARRWPRSRLPAGAPDVARLAEHAEAAGDAQAVLKYAPAAAARAATVGAHREAAALYARAVRFADDAAVRAGLLDSQAREAI